MDTQSFSSTSTIELLRMNAYISLPTQLKVEYTNQMKVYINLPDYSINLIPNQPEPNIFDPFSELPLSERGYIINIPERAQESQFNTDTPLLYDQDTAIDLAYVSFSNLQILELEIVIKFKKFEEVTDIYIKEIEQLITVRVFINLDQYNYELMNKIFDNAEFPIKDEFNKDILIDFKYIYSVLQRKEPLDYLGKLIYHKSSYGK